MTQATLIDGKAMAARVTEAVTAETADLAARGIKPGLAVVIVGEDPASQVYVRNKQRKAEACGFHSVKHVCAADVGQDDLLKLIGELNDDSSIHGILVQLPLPGHLDEQLITQSISPSKDVDGFHFVNIGKLTAGHVDDAFVPCTPAGCMLMVEGATGRRPVRQDGGDHRPLQHRRQAHGQPAAQANATVTICHSRTADLADVARGADILVAAVGRPDMVQGDWIKPGAVVIDVGINRIE